ncbi:response regulator transcription factor [Streptomyces sp. NPDC048241]|uniref:response regulator transcription factor n=1 Tax=Streptomyces sp. NPDC048241 TaxID=3365521 RepID=UPI003716459A
MTDMVGEARRSEGWEVRTAATAAEALVVNASFEPDAVVLDWMLPDGDGPGVLCALRCDRPGRCVLFLTARDVVEDRVAGITAGADARIRGLMRRAGLTAQHHPDGADLVVGDLVMDESARDVSRGGRHIDLAKTEFELLRYLMRNPRRVLSKAQILDRVWAYDFGGRAHVVELYISYLRKKIDAGHPPLIHTVRGVGYVLRPEQR